MMTLMLIYLLGGKLACTVVLSQGGYSGFQVTGMIEDFFGFEIFDSRIFLGAKIWQVFFGVA